MDNNKINKFLLVTTILTTLILVIGGTFSYFTVASASRMNAIDVSAGKIRLGLKVTQENTGFTIIPLNDKDIKTAYQQKCKDDYGYGACLSYGLEVVNYEAETEVEGIINFEVNNLENLSYMVLDEEGNTYLDIQHIDKENSKNLSLGAPFKLSKSIDAIYPSKKFILLVWLTNIEEPQEETDAGQVFNADVTYRSTTGGRLTASVEGYGNNNGESTLGGNQ